VAHAKANIRSVVIVLLLRNGSGNSEITSATCGAFQSKSLEIMGFGDAMGISQRA